MIARSRPQYDQHAAPYRAADGQLGLPTARPCSPPQLSPDQSRTASTANLTLAIGTPQRHDDTGETRKRDTDLRHRHESLVHIEHSNSIWRPARPGRDPATRLLRERTSDGRNMLGMAFDTVAECLN